jgi:hypothetical protein
MAAWNPQLTGGITGSRTSVQVCENVGGGESLARQGAGRSALLGEGGSGGGVADWDEVQRGTSSVWVSMRVRSGERSKFVA